MQRAFSRRLLGIRAWFTECAIDGPKGRRHCLTEGVETLRRWRDERLSRSALLLLHAYFASSVEGMADLRTVLTPEEFAVAFRDGVAR